jgi:acetyltransferase
MNSPIHLNLKPLLSPRSVAVIGASKMGEGYGGRFVENLRKSGFSGKIYLVNPKHECIDDMPCYTDVEALPETVDLAAILVPKKFVLGVLEQCVKKRVKAALIISSGFSEAGEEGRLAQAALQEVSLRNGLPVCGPNCLGIVNLIDRVMIHSSRHLSPPAGDIGLVSQSGALAISSVLPQAADRGIHFSYVVSSGNEAVLETIDFMDYFVHDPSTKVICCFLEGFKGARRFLPVADEAIDSGKPIIVCKVGRTTVGSRQALSHTGSMTGSDEAYQAVFEQKGVIRVPDPDDLFEVASIFARSPKPEGEGLAILTTSGGMGSLLADKCGVYGIQLPPLSENIQKYLSDSRFLLVLGEPVNPVDIRGQGADHLPKILQPFLEDDRYHLILVALCFLAVGKRSTQIARDLIDFAAHSKKPLIVLWPGTKINAEGGSSEEDGFRLLEKSNIPIYYNPGKCIRAINAFVSYHRFRNRWMKRKQELPLHVDSSGAKSFLEQKQGALDEIESRRLLSFYGIPVPKEQLVTNIDEALIAANDTGYPVVLKVVSKELPHKTEVGGVSLSISDEKALRSAYVGLLKSVQKNAPHANIRGVLVQKMIPNAYETIVGFTQDKQFGPVVLFGLGGVFVEVMRDVSRRLPPLTLDDARDMVSQVKGARILKGYRGQPAADFPALYDVILRIGQMALDLQDKIAEMEINPLLVRQNGMGACAVDALVTLKGL